jgi:CheY-like chemotaxis protein
MTNIEVRRELPYLRRYARALTGAQSQGDGYVRNLLEALIADPTLLGSNEPTRVDLYQLFHRLHRYIPLADSAEDFASGEIELAIQWRFEGLAPVGRQLLMLTVLENFSLSDAALIVDVSLDQAQVSLDQAFLEIENQSRSSVLIIEDEPLIAMELESLVMELGHQVVGNAITHREAVTLFEENRPGLVLADIQLADGSSGINAVKDILSITDVPVIFITTYPERLLTGDRPEPTYLITKPFNIKMVQIAIAQALFLKSTAKPLIAA